MMYFLSFFFNSDKLDSANINLSIFINHSDTLQDVFLTDL